MFERSSVHVAKALNLENGMRMLPLPERLLPWKNPSGENKMGEDEVSSKM